MNDRGFDRDKFLSETWPEALRSGRYERGIGRLFSGGRYCPLGVACDLLEKIGVTIDPGWRKEFTLPADVTSILGITDGGRWCDGYGKSVSYKSDTGVDFVEIADLIVSIKDDLLVYAKSH